MPETSAARPAQTHRQGAIGDAQALPNFDATELKTSRTAAEADVGGDGQPDRSPANDHDRVERLGAIQFRWADNE
jgi:hypothetical protein